MPTQCRPGSSRTSAPHIPTSPQSGVAPEDEGNGDSSQKGLSTGVAPRPRGGQGTGTQIPWFWEPQPLYFCPHLSLIHSDDVEAELLGQFREHHYKDHRLMGQAVCFVGELGGRAVAFLAALQPGMTVAWIMARNQSDKAKALAKEMGFPVEWLARHLMREHRTVVAPEFQGLGLGSLMADMVAYLFEEMDIVFMSTARGGPAESERACGGAPRGTPPRCERGRLGLGLPAR